MISNDFEIYIKGMKKKDFLLPINPIDNFKITKNNKIEAVDVVGLGEALLKRNSELSTFGWSSFFPADTKENHIISGLNDFLDPKETAKMFKEAENDTITLIINKITNGIIKPYINTEAIIKNFETQDKAGNSGDIFYSITLVEYNVPNIKPCEIIPINAPLALLDFDTSLALLAYNTPIQRTTKGGGSGQTIKTGDNNTTSDKISVGSVVKITGMAYEYKLADYKITGTDDNYFEKSGGEYFSNYIQDETATIIQIKKGKEYNPYANYYFRLQDKTFYKVRLQKNYINELENITNTAIALTAKALFKTTIKNELKEAWFEAGSIKGKI